MRTVFDPSSVFQLIFRCFALSIPGVACLAASTDSGESYSETLVQELTHVMEQPTTITRRNGSRFTGRFAYGSAEGVVLSHRVEGGGVVEVPFSWEEVQSIDLPGQEWWSEIEDVHASGDYHTVIAGLEVMYSVWSAFFPGIPEPERMRFLMLAEALLRVEHYESALGLLRRLAEGVQDKQTLGRIVDMQIIACLQLGLHPEAFALAGQRIERSEDASEATLAWIAIAVHHIAHQRYRQAWVASVHPLMFDRNQTPDLADAYLIAMVSTLRLNLPAQALQYYDAFKASGMDMKENPHTRSLLVWYRDVDWEAIRLDPIAGMEPYTDLKPESLGPTGIAISDIPSMPIPLRQP